MTSSNAVRIASRWFKSNDPRDLSYVSPDLVEEVRIIVAPADAEMGRPVFRDLLFRRRQCVFIAPDLLYLNGKTCAHCRQSNARPH